MLSFLFLFILLFSYILTVISVQSYLTTRNCQQTCGPSAILPQYIAQHYTPPLLYTFPGSGNGWVRLLVEYSTGYLTGSVYDDHSLYLTHRGERLCSKYVIMIKMHPTLHNFDKMMKGRSSSRCHGVGTFKRAVFLIRDPLDAIFSDYNRRVTGSHAGHVTRNRFNWTIWEQKATYLAEEYQNMEPESYEPFKRAFPNGYMYVKYEHLKDTATRMKTLQGILDFLGFYKPENALQINRMECAFVLAASKPTSYRAISTHTGTRKGSGDEYVTKDELYTQDIVCNVIWPRVRNTAEVYGYTLSSHNITCA